PNTPCRPGGSPVPKLVRLVAVVVGLPTVIGRPVSEARNGAWAGWARNRFHPRPSTSSTQYRRAEGRPSVSCSPGTLNAPRTDGNSAAGAASPSRGKTSPPDGEAAVTARAPAPAVLAR